MGNFIDTYRVRHPGAIAPLAAIATTFAIAATIAAPAAHAGAANFFRSQGCPVSYRAQNISVYTNDKAPSYAKALNQWKFSDVRGKKLQPPVNWRRGGSKTVRSKMHQMKFLDRLFGIADERKLDSTRPFSGSDRKRALDHAVEIAADWSRAANKGRIDAKTAWKPRIAGIRAPYLAYAARRGACAGALSNGDAGQIRKALYKHVNVLKRKPERSTPQNHKLSLYSGAAMLGSYFRGDRKLRSAAEKAGKRFIKSVSGGYQRSEGVWLEHSPRYQRLSYEVLDAWIKRVDPGAKSVRRIRDRLFSSLGWMLQPDNRLVTFGDTSGEPTQSQELINNRKHGWWVARRSGYAVQSGPENWFGTTAQYHARQHKQADELTFDLVEKGERVIQDTGFLHKEKDYWGRFQASAQAHSTLTVDGRSFDWKLHRNPYGSAIKASGQGDGWYAVQATNPLLKAPKGLSREQRTHSSAYRDKVLDQIRNARRFNADHTRTFIYKPGYALIVVDSVRAPRAHTYRRHFQFGPDVSTARVNGDLRFKVGGVDGLMLTDSAQPGASLSTNQGSDSGLLSYVFPEVDQKRKRTTATVTTRAKDLDQTSGLFYGRTTPTELKLTQSSDGVTKVRTFGLLGLAGPEISVTRSGGTLTVSEDR